MENKSGMKVGPVKVVGEWYPESRYLRLTIKDEMVPGAVFGHPELDGIIPMAGETVVLLRPAEESDDYASVEHLRLMLGVPTEV